MITIQTLKNSSVDELVEVFNLSFSDYIVPLSLTREQLKDKLKSESINLEFSVGAFEEGRLIAFILHGFDEIDGIKVVYNGGTGVIPNRRGNKLTAQLYEYILPVFEKAGIEKVQLEVISTNAPAIRTYERIGFRTIRNFVCFKGSISLPNNTRKYKIGNIKDHEWPLLQSFWDIKPSWQNSKTAVELLGTSVEFLGVYDEKSLVGYAIYNTKSKRAHQLAVEKNHRLSGIGRELLKHISENFGNEIAIINVDESSQASMHFMKRIGLVNFIQQYQMELTLK